MTNIKSTSKLTILIMALIILATPSLFAQDYVLFDATGLTQDEVVQELLLNQTYQFNYVKIVNLIYYPFGTKVDVGSFYKCDPWFDSNKTYGFTRTDLMYDYNFNFLFQPSTLEGQKLFMKLNGNYYNSPVKVSIVGINTAHTLNTGTVINMFLVETLTINNTFYSGPLPDDLVR